MCGIFGIFDQNLSPISKNILSKMGASIRHRGPDHQGIFSGEGVAFGNQRLAIIDLEHGNQPMYGHKKQVVVIQNGEIFNFVELRRTLEKAGHRFETNCDTEIILRGYEEWGLDLCPKLNGMFAIAIFDQKKDALFLIRDRAGEKPLYWAKEGRRIFFASEIKSLLVALERSPDIDKNGLASYLQLGFVLPPLTIYQGIEHLPPAHYLSITRDKVEVQRWWSIANQAEKQREEKEVTEEVDNIFTISCSLRVRSDVPFGAFMSGGLDSSLTVAKIQHRGIKSFNISFPDTAFDERAYAQEVADKLGSEHSVINFDHHSLADWPDFIWYCDQPHADISFLPLMMLSKRAVKDVKMVLTGDGADELYAGYDDAVQFFYNYQKGTDADIAAYYLKKKSIFDTCSDFLLQNFKQQIKEVSNLDHLNKYLYLDFRNLLPGNNLVKVDRMGMAYSLETRCPFMDYHLIEHSFGIPGKLKVANRENKYLLKQIALAELGESLVYRKKNMFTVPLTEWQQGGFFAKAMQNLQSKNTLIENFVDRKLIDEVIKGYGENKRAFVKKVRSLISLELFLQRFFPQSR